MQVGGTCEFVTGGYVLYENEIVMRRRKKGGESRRIRRQVQLFDAVNDKKSTTVDKSELSCLMT